jgi:hypothetical protein
VELRDISIAAIGSRTLGHPSWIDRWVEARPGDYLALLFRGDYRVAWAWQARGIKRFKDTAHEAYDEFQQRLGLAKADLERAAAVAPEGDAGAWVSMITMARGLNYDKPALNRLFDEAQRRYPWHEIAVWSMIQGLAPKWSGSLEAMFDLARAAAANAPDGSGAHVALVSAHYESSAEEGSAFYWRVPGVVDDIIEAARHSIYSPAYVPSVRSLQHHNLFLYAFGRVEQWDDFQRELEYVDGRLMAPFSQWADPSAPYGQLRQLMAASRIEKTPS